MCIRDRAEWVLRGVVPYPDRAAFAAGGEPTSQLVGYDFAVLRPRRPTRASAQRAWRTVLGLHGDTPVANLDAMTAWQAAGAAAVPALRDEVLNLVCPGFSSGQIGPGLARGPYDVLGPVSYTHLDVYKRQTQAHAVPLAVRGPRARCRNGQFEALWTVTPRASGPPARPTGRGGDSQHASGGLSLIHI